MNLPNKLTVARIIIVPFFLIAMLTEEWIPYHTVWALILFAIASYTDHLDGKIARKNNMITDFGKLMDPLADKILVISALVCFVEFQWADAWIIVLIIAREFLVTGIRLVAAENGEVLAANRWGKTKTISQIASICCVLIFQFVQELSEKNIIPRFTIGGAPSGYALTALGRFLIFISAFFAVLSGIIYVKQNIRLINTTK